MQSSMLRIRLCRVVAEQMGPFTIYGFPPERAAAIAVAACRPSSMDIVFCCYSPADLKIYQAALES